jgi:hypothetical protein
MFDHVTAHRPLVTDGHDIRLALELTAATGASQHCATVPWSPRLSLRQAMSEGA